jgi:crossover junction endodeoxyribonuclease RusA
VNSVNAPPVIEIDLPLHKGKVPLTLNQRLGPYEKNRRTQVVRAAAGWRAKALNLGAVEHISVGMHYATGDNRGRDTDNLVPTLKAACDGLVDSGLVPSDLPKHMTKIMPTIHNGPGPRRLWLTVTVTDLSEESA